MSLLEQGFEVIDPFLSREQLQPLYDEIGSVSLAAKTGGVRNAEKKFCSVEALASSDYLLSYASRYLNGKPQLVRAILFNKTAENNWLVTWHQDKTVTVSDKFEARGWGPWSIKEDVHHVQPPQEVLENMVTFRIHLDDTDRKNGCLKVIPGSHRQGVVAQSTIDALVTDAESVLCEVNAGSALVMRPHILHASSKATEPSQRRILHLEYCAFSLPDGIEWA